MLVSKSLGYGSQEPYISLMIEPDVGWEDWRPDGGMIRPTWGPNMETLLANPEGWVISIALVNGLA
jgi:hypothetical protein